jgi:hypothetical protein
MEREVRVGDIGTIFQITVRDSTNVVNLSNATSISLVFKKPNKQIITRSAAVAGDGTGGIVTYTSKEGDFDIKGNYQMQITIVSSSGAWSSNIVGFQVYPCLQ